jgi:gamma-glutamylcyclotransferase (GGCT)/AIG2-like uncharacterized protein YtfP
MSSSDAVSLLPMNEADSRTALAVYGSLAPGESNHWVVSRIAGDWIDGVINGYTFDLSWGPAEGYEGFLPDPDGPEVRVAVLLSAELDSRWREIDDFEGLGYERRVLPVRLEDGQTVDAHIYVALTDV